MSRFDPRKAVLSRHVGHQLVVVDARSLRCVPCAVTVLLDANREAPDEPGLRPPTATRSTSTVRVLPACPRCARRVPHTDVDGVPEPQPHTSASSAGARLCTPPPAQLPPGGWRALVDQLGAPARSAPADAGSSAQHDGPGVASRAVDTSTARDRRAADAATSSVGHPHHATRGS